MAYHPGGRSVRAGRSVIAQTSRWRLRRVLLACRARFASTPPWLGLGLSWARVQAETEGQEDQAMAAVVRPVVVCSYPARDHAEEFVAVLRKLGVSVAVVPSDCHAGAWDVMVPGRDAAGVKKIVDEMLATD
jgi:hypothetical protein